MRWRRLLSRALLLAVMLTALTVSTQADAVTDTIGVYIGYFGWSEDEYVEKATYHWTELDDWYGGRLDTHEVVYSYYNGARTYLARGRGFYIRDLLKYAGVDLNSIASIDFLRRTTQTARTARSRKNRSSTRRAIIFPTSRPTRRPARSTPPTAETTCGSARSRSRRCSRSRIIRSGTRSARTLKR